MTAKCGNFGDLIVVEGEPIAKDGILSSYLHVGTDGNIAGEQETPLVMTGTVDFTCVFAFNSPLAIMISCYGIYYQRRCYVFYSISTYARLIFYLPG